MIFICNTGIYKTQQIHSSRTDSVMLKIRPFHTKLVDGGITPPPQCESRIRESFAKNA